MKIGNKELQVPIIQGGMGVGVSLGNLAGHVAKCGGLGVISSVNAGYKEPRFGADPKGANFFALKNEIKKAKTIANGNGLVGVNIMTAVSNYEETARIAAEAGADVIISGAGLPLKLPEYIEGTDTLFAPIVSSGKAAALLCKNYSKKYHRLPDFFVLEGHMAGGHLGFSYDELVCRNAKSNDEILTEVFEAVKPYEEEAGRKIPVFVAGGVFDGRDMAHFMKLGAAGVQIGTRFIATEECDAHPNFKQMMVDAKAEDVRIVASPVGMPARALYTPLLKRLESGEKFRALKCNNCLTACKKGDNIPYCISRALIEAVQGNVEDGLFFCGENVHRIERIVTVEALMKEILEEAQRYGM
ncbi:MAG: nitronate monooxygenase [Lachnospiraceae bacterium]|nr:nitronate monooxygenase [Lachnospiraceae bacterium]